MIAGSAADGGDVGDELGAAHRSCQDRQDVLARILKQGS